MANIYYNEKTGLPEFKVGPLGFCLTGLVLFMSVLILLTWVFIKCNFVCCQFTFLSQWNGQKVIIRKIKPAHDGSFRKEVKKSKQKERVVFHEVPAFFLLFYTTAFFTASLIFSSNSLVIFGFSTRNVLAASYPRPRLAPS